MTTFIFLRHGEAGHNVAARTEGDAAYFDPRWKDACLTAEGIEQVRGVLSDIEFDVIYCSPLRRCIETLHAALPSSVDMKVCLDDRLMEPQGSHICNKRASRPEIAVSVPTAWDYRGVEYKHPYDTWGGEAGNEETPHFVNRVRHASEWLMRRYPGQRIVIVGHYQWIRTWFRIYQGKIVYPANGEILVGACKKLTGEAGVLAVSDNHDKL